MKIMYVDIVLDGHHLSYLNALIKKNDNECCIVAPEKVVGMCEEQYVFSKMDFLNKKINKYYKWINEVYNFASYAKPDVIHFLYGDVFYKYFGLGLKKFTNKYKTVVTFHGFRTNKISQLSMKRIFHNISIGVVHTQLIEEKIKLMGVNNVSHIEYPHFSSSLNVSNSGIKEEFGIKTDAPVLGCLGSTRYDKGLDILLKALKEVKNPFELLIAGTEDFISKEMIIELSKEYSSKVHIMIKYLSEEEFEKALVVSDIIVLPYRKVFNGASGPLGEGVWKEKMIIGPDHGSLGDIIKKNHLGYTFLSEDSKDIASTINRSLNQPFEYDVIAQKYRKSLTVEEFATQYKKIYQDNVRIDNV